MCVCVGGIFFLTRIREWSGCGCAWVREWTMEWAGVRMGQGVDGCWLGSGRGSRASDWAREWAGV